MDDFSLDGWEECWEADPEGQVGSRGGHVWVEGVQISYWDRPDCLRHRIARCDRCSFFDPESCPLRLDPEVRSYLEYTLEGYHERLVADRARVRRFAKALRAELRAHGRPLHYTVLAQIVADRHPELDVTEARVLRVLARFPKVFEKTADGVYWVKAR